MGSPWFFLRIDISINGRGLDKTSMWKDSIDMLEGKIKEQSGLDWKEGRKDTFKDKIPPWKLWSYRMTQDSRLCGRAFEFSSSRTSLKHRLSRGTDVGCYGRRGKGLCVYLQATFYLFEK